MPRLNTLTLCAAIAGLLAMNGISLAAEGASTKSGENPKQADAEDVRVHPS